jgi:hypothetical protein
LLGTSEELYSNTLRVDLDVVYCGLKFGGTVMVQQSI